MNLRGVIAVTHAVLPGMQERRRGRIVNTASEAGRVGSSGSAVYSAAKAGVIGFTKAIAIENGRYGITANAVAPGPIETPLLMGAPEALGDLGKRIVENMIGSTNLRRLGQPDEVAAAITFLASDDASYITGQALGVSGGLARTLKRRERWSPSARWAHATGSRTSRRSSPPTTRCGSSRCSPAPACGGSRSRASCART